MCASVAAAKEALPGILQAGKDLKEIQAAFIWACCVQEELPALIQINHYESCWGALSFQGESVRPLKDLADAPCPSP